MKRNSRTTRRARKPQDSLFVAAEQTPRRGLLASARRLLWSLLRTEAESQTARGVARTTLRRRLARFLEACSAVRLAAILRSAAFASAVATALVSGSSARAEELPPVELAAIAGGEGGFMVRGEGEPASRLGGSVAEAGDVNGDGVADVIVGGAQSRGRGSPTYVVFGKPSGEPIEVRDLQKGVGGFVIRGASESDRAGQSVAGAGDLNGDGLADLIVGAPGADPGGRESAGETYVVFGKAEAAAVELADVQAGAGGFVIRGASDGDRSGASVSGAGDLNGDGLADLIVGASRADPGGRENAGENYVVFGKADGAPVELADVQTGAGGFVIGGASDGDLSGGRVSGAGDVNGDGLADLLIGSYRADPGGRELAGESYVVFGKADGAPLELADVQAGVGGFVIRGASERDHSGRSVSRAGDLNGDGLADVLIGAPGRYGPAAGAGETYVVFGKPDGAPVDLANIRAGHGGLAILCRLPGDDSGKSVAGGGDLNGDGFPDLLIASNLPDTRYPSHSGATYVVFGRPEWRGLASRFRRGAVRGLESLDISDGIRLLEFLFLGGPQPPCLDAADADDSGVLDIRDAVRIFGYLFLGSDAPPPPGPLDCGVDPTVDGLGCSVPSAGC